MYDPTYDPIQRTTLLEEVLSHYGESFDAWNLREWWSDWGGHPPMTREEAESAIHTFERASRLGVLSHEVVLPHRQVVRDIVLARRGVDLRRMFHEDDRKLAVRVVCDCLFCDEDDCERFTVKDMTGEIIRMALEWE